MYLRFIICVDFPRFIFLDISLAISKFRPDIEKKGSKHGKKNPRKCGQNSIESVITIKRLKKQEILIVFSINAKF